MTKYQYREEVSLEKASILGVKVSKSPGQPQALGRKVSILGQ